MSSVVSTATNASKHGRDDDLWRSAYKRLKHDPDSKLDKFHKVVQKHSESKGLSSSGHLSSANGRQKMLKLINAEASAMKPKNGTFDKVVQTILKTKELVSTGIAASPPAAIAVAGIFMVFSIQQNYRQEEEAACEVVALVARIIVRRALEEGECYSKPGDKKEMGELREHLYFSYQDLYFKLLSAIAKTLCWLKKPKGQRVFDTMWGRVDWVAEERNLSKADSDCVDILEDIHRSNANPAGKESPWKRGRNLLHQNAAMGYETRVAELLDTHAFPPNEKTDKGWTALSLAAEGGHVKICKSLLSLKDIDIELQNNRGRTALHIAAMKNRVEIVRALIGEGAKVNVKDKDRKTPLHLAAQDGRRDVVDALCKAPGIELDLSDKEGRSALHLASLKEKTAVLKLLSERGAKVDRKDTKKRTAFLDAAEAGNIELLKTLQACGANINQQTATHRWSALHYCVSRDRLKCLKTLLAFPGIKLDITNTDDRTPLHEAVLKSRTSIVKALADKGSAIDTRDKKKRSPFLDAAKAGKGDMVKKLREKGADLNQVSGVNGWSALHEVANKNHIEVARYLVSEGIKLDLKVKGGTRKGLTARGIAEARKSKDVLEFLREYERIEVQLGE
ncbi:hypothetical protein DPSP01_004053 [Paraphaeosphaeria sporulosa]